jgi:hypothetical protein
LTAALLAIGARVLSLVDDPKLTHRSFEAPTLCSKELKRREDAPLGDQVRYALPQGARWKIINRALEIAPYGHGSRHYAVDRFNRSLSAEETPAIGTRTDRENQIS